MYSKLNREGLVSIPQQGLQQYRQGYFSQALKSYEQALAIYRQLNDKAGIGQSLNDIGMVYILLNKNDQALEVLQQALLIRRQLKDGKGECEKLEKSSQRNQTQ